MPRTRSQAVESPLVSLDTPRRKRKATTTTKSSATVQEETAPKPKRGRKLAKKEVAPEKASEEPTPSKSEIIETQSIETTQPQPPQELQTQEPQGDVPIAEAAKDNGSIIPPITPKREANPDASSVTSRGSSPSICSPAKKRSVQKALATVKEALKKPRQLIKQRLNRLRNSSEPTEGPQTVAASKSFPSTDYSLAEDEILDAALEIVLHRMESDSFTTNPFMPSSIRCPCCRGALKFQCPENHDLQSWIPDEAKEAMNAVLTTMFAEGIVTASEEKENARRAERKPEAKTKHQIEEPRKAAPQNKKVELSSKARGKKRARESHEDDGPDEAPRAQRPRLTSSAGRTPFSKRRTATPHTATPRRKLPYSEIRRRALEREQENAPSIFRLDEIVAQHEAREKAEKAAEEAAEAERLLAISRTAMERHAVMGPVPEEMRDSFEVPVFDDAPRDSHTTEAHEPTENHEANEEAHQVNEANQVNEASEAPETPSPNTWGFDIRNFFTSVTGSVRRFVPNFRQERVRAVPFGNATPIAANGTAGRPAATNGDVNGDTPTPANGNRNNDTGMDLTYSLFPPPLELPVSRSDSQPSKGDGADQLSNGTTLTAAPAFAERTGTADVPNVEQGTTPAIGRDNLQEPLASAQNLSNGEPSDADKEPESASASNKRKRERPPSPDVIPNPPGCSYGLHDDYFTYSDDEIEEAEAYCAAEAAASTIAPVAERSEKRARFLSPEEDSSNVRQKETTNVRQRTPPWEERIPPGWARATTTVYTGKLFKGMRPQIQEPQTPLAFQSSPAREQFHTPSFQTPSHQAYPLRSPQTWGSPYGTQRLRGINFRSKEDTGRPPSQIYPRRGSFLDLRRERLRRNAIAPLGRSSTLWSSVNSRVNAYLETPGPSQPPRIPANESLANPSMPWDLNQQPSADSTFANEPVFQQQAATTNISENDTVPQPTVTPLMPQESNQQPPAISTFSNESASQQQAATMSIPANGLVAQSPPEHADVENPVTPRPNIAPETTSLPPIIQPLSAASKGQSGTNIHKPSNPSRLRQAMRLSSSPLSQPSPATNLSEPSQQDLMQVFGDDEFGRQAYDIYKSCPSGDLSQVQWPTFESLPENGVQQSIDSTPLDESQQLTSRNTFQTSFEQFQSELDQGLIDPDEILGDLPL
ncbi:hypothetical protein UA08_01541 [Talaromyces atroroseus]|uniref:Uncharacterized protein n=1 Tax=Talaromyces atroroseus TaxID=1441469 RepID=A0A1Q5QB53_TALAT|nr:hypothetical protein UA08_01541 [Talaromyces atroroseus]OKL63173.1 hypothetical protein UA08_01541 [Talaromyces atroroseus]